MTSPRARIPCGPQRGRGLAVGALAALLAATCAAHAGDARADEHRESCAADLESGLKLLALAEKGDLPAAKRAWETFESAERRCPEDPRFPFFGGLSHVYGDDPDGAVASLARLRGMLAVPLRERNRPEGEVDLNSHVLFLRAAFNFRVRRESQAAAEQLTRVRMRDPTFYPSSVSSLLFKALLAWGADLESKGEFPAAIARTLRAKEEARYDLDSKRRDAALRNLAQLYRIGEQWTDAQAVWEDLLKRYPKDPVLRYGLASVYADLMQFDRAVEQYKACLDALKEAPVEPADAAQIQDAPLRYGVSLSLASLSLANANQAKEGLAVIAAYSKKFPEDARAYYYLGKIEYEQLSRAPEARVHLEKARELDPFCDITIRLLKTVYAELLDAPDKEKVAERAKELERVLWDEGEKKKREQEMARRKVMRKDRTDGCR